MPSFILKRGSQCHLDKSPTGVERDIDVDVTAVGLDFTDCVGTVVELEVILMVSKVVGFLNLHPHRRLSADHVGFNCTTNVFFKSTVRKVMVFKKVLHA